MPFLNVSLSPDLVADTAWQRHIDGDDETNLYSLSARLFQEAREQAANGPTVRTDFLKLVAAATSLNLMDGSKPPFQAMVRIEGKRSPALEDFGEFDAEALASIASSISSPAVRARVADVAATVGQEVGSNQWRSGALAAEAYLELGERHLLDNDGIRVLEEFVRGLHLAWVYDRRNETLHERYWSLLRGAITKSLNSERIGIAGTLAREVRKFRHDIAGDVATEFQQAIERFSSKGDHHSAASCAEHAAELWQRAKKKEQAKECRLRHGEEFVSLGTTAAGVSLARAHWLREGIQALRKAGADPARVDELRRQLAHAERESLSDFRPVEFRVDVADIHELLKRHLVGPTLMESLLQMVLGTFSWPNFEIVRQQVLDDAQRHPFSAIFTSDLVNNDGNVVAQQKPLNISDEESVYQAMVRHCVDGEMKLRADTLVLHAVDWIFTHFHPALWQLVEIVAASPMVPPRHEESLARGLLAGFNWDWLECAVYLIPQVEPFVRHQFQLNDKNTLILREDGTQAEKTLNELLRSSEAEAIFGKDLILELETLTTNQVGFVLRHKWAHGLLDDPSLANCGVQALWWTMWRMILWPWLADYARAHASAKPAPS